MVVLTALIAGNVSAVRASELQPAVAEVLDDSQFRVLDEFRDEADLGGGRKVMRIYRSSRLLYSDNGVLRTRPQGWNQFHEQKESRLTPYKGTGYAFIIPFSDGLSVGVSAGDLEQSTKTKSMNVGSLKSKFEQKTSNMLQTISTYKDVYPDVDVNFIDRRDVRTKEIVIKQKPKIESSENIIFWEQYTVPTSAKIFVGMDRYIDTVTTTLPVQIQGVSGETILITPSVVFDSTFSKDDPQYLTFLDMTQEPLSQVVSYDRTHSLLKIGTIISGAYLSDERRVYPVVIDPTYKYFTCDTSTCEGDIYLKWMTGKSNWDDANLITGYDDGAGPSPCTGGNTSRHAVLKFNFAGASIPSGNQISDARVWLTRNTGVTGCGEYNGDIAFKAKKINQPWALASNIDYNYVRGTLTSGGASRVLSQSSPCTNCDFALDTAMVTNWMTSPSTNYGILIEPEENFPSGTTVPASWSSKQRLFWFYSSNNSIASYDPYLEITYTPTITPTPDLTIYSSSVNDTTVDPGQSITAYVRVKNSGTGTAASSNVGYYYSTNSVCSTGSDSWLGSDSVESLGANVISTEDNQSIIIPSNAVRGQTGYICFIADINSSVSESNENNNTASIAVTINNEVTSPDLTIYSSSVNDTTVDPGQSITAYVRVKNSGTGTAGSSNVGYYYSTNSVCSTGSDSWLGSDSVESLGANVISTEDNQSIIIPSNAVRGQTGYICFIADINSSVSESNENNNTASIAVTINLAPTIHDIDIISATFPSPNQNLTDGQRVTINVQLKNNGTVSETVPFSLYVTDQTSEHSYSLNNLSTNQTMNSGDTFTYGFSGEIPNNSAMLTNYSQFKGKIVLNVSNDVDGVGNDSLSTANTVNIRRNTYATGGGGGGSSVPEVVEAFVGTRVGQPDVKPVYDTAVLSYMAGKPDVQSAVYGADPVNLRTGAFEFSQTDFALSGRGIPIDFTRTYLSTLSERSGRFGNGWSFSYNSYYYLDDTTKNVQLYYGGALVAIFSSSNGGQTFTAPPGVFDTLAWQGTAFTSPLVYTSLDGIKHIYSKVLTNNVGILETIVDTNGNVTTLGYTDVRSVPLLTSVTDASGRGIQLTYGSVDDDVRWDNIVELQDTFSTTNPRKTTYTYDDNDNLITVTDNRAFGGNTYNIVENYLYDADGLLMKYTDPRGTILRNQYDSFGRVTAQYESNPDVDPAGADRKVYEISYQNTDPLVSGSSACTLTMNYRYSTSTYTNRVCFNANQLKIYSANGLGNAEYWTYDSNGMPATYTDANGHTTTYTHDAKRRLTDQTLVDVDGWHTTKHMVYENTFNRMTSLTETAEKIGEETLTKTTTYEIDPTNGNVRSITDPLLGVERFTYSEQGNMLTKTDKNGNQHGFGYGVGGNYLETDTVTVRDADDVVTDVVQTYAYDDFGNRTSYTTPKGAVFTYEYDTNGNLRRETDPLGNVTNYGYDVENHKISETNARGYTTTYTYAKDISASLTKIETVADGVTRTTLREYDWVGNLTKEIDPLGRETVYIYDPANRLYQKQLPYNAITYTYDAVGNVIGEVNWLNEETHSFYDARNRLKETRRQKDTSGTNFTSTFITYDGFDRPITMVDANGNTSTKSYDLLDRVVRQTDALVQTVTTTYDNNGNVKTQTDKQGHITTFYYDALNLTIKTIYPDLTETLTFYDENGNVSRQVEKQNADGTDNTHTKTFGYTSRNELLSESDAYGATNVYSYDSVGNKLSTLDPMSRRTRYGYDGFNRLITETDPDGNITHYAYDLVGNKTSVTYSDGTTTRFEYNNQSLPKKIIDALGNTQQFTYDPVGRQLTKTDALLRTTVSVYNLLGQLVRETNPKNVVVAYTYDKNGNRLTQTVDGTVTTTYAYDALNRVTDVVSPGNKTEQYTYDENNNLSTKTDGKSQTTTYTYDVMNRMTSETPDRMATTSYAYDNWGNLVAVDDTAGTTEYQYDFVNRPTLERKTYPNVAKMFDITREYYADGQLKTLTDPAEVAITYTYDTRGLLDMVKKGNEVLADYTQSIMKRPDTMVYGNGLTTNYTYDDTQRVATITVTNASSTVLFSHAYEYDAENNRTKLTETNGRTIEYGYDLLDELTRVDYSDATGTQDITFAYDNRGNRLSNQTPFGGATYQYNTTSDELVGQLVNGRLSVAYTYDGNGSLTTEQYSRYNNPVQTVFYYWNTKNQLKGINYLIDNLIGLGFGSPQNVVEFDYDYLGNRVKKTVNSEATYYLNDGLRVLNELDAEGNVTKTIVIGLGQIAEIDAPGTITYVHQDSLGSTVMLSDDTGAVTGQYEYDVFGSVLGYTGSAESNYLFTNQEYDSESELYYYNARYYNPSIGRFLSRDTVIGKDGDVLSRNRYIYVSNNPLKFVDPSGEDKEKESGVNWSTVGKGVVQTLFGGLQTLWGVAETSAGAALATGGTATGVGAVPGIAAGIGVGALGVNNVIGGGSTFASGLTNLWRGLTGQSSVDYSYNPADKAIDYVVPQGAGNTAAHIGYTVVDIFGGGAGVWKAGQIASKVSTAENSVANTEKYYRTMNEADFASLQRTGRLSATNETFITPCKSYACQYSGRTVEFEVQSGTTNALREIGVRDYSPLVQQHFGDLPLISNQVNWTHTNAFFKKEAEDLINIGLGKGKALDIFNDSIIKFNQIFK